MNQLVYFLTILSVGLIIPHLITSNQGFQVVQNTPCGVNDHVLNWLAPVSGYLQSVPSVQRVLVASSSLLIDIQYVLMVLAIARRRKVIHALPFVLFYALRALIQRVVYLPIIADGAWSNPGVPTLTIFYEQVYDYYPSGHVGIILMCYLYHKRIGEDTVARLALVNLPFQAITVLVTRTHYSLDVIGGLLLAYSLWCLTKRILFPCKMRGRTLRIINQHNRQPCPEVVRRDASTSVNYRGRFDQMSQEPANELSGDEQ